MTNLTPKQLAVLEKYPEILNEVQIRERVLANSERTVFGSDDQNTIESLERDLDRMLAIARRFVELAGKWEEGIPKLSLLKWLDHQIKYYDESKIPDKPRDYNYGIVDICKWLKQILDKDLLEAAIYQGPSQIKEPT